MAEELLSIRNAAFSYGAVEVFRDISFGVSEGEVICILGANGCGKTTLLRCLGGMLRLREGKVTLARRDIATLIPTEIARLMGIVFQEHSAPFPFSVLEVVTMGRAPHLGFLSAPSGRDVELAEKALETVGALHLRNKPYTQISGGERQLVLIARTLAQQPKVMLFDEPTSHLDFRNETRILAIVHHLAGQGMAVIMTTHRPNHALMAPSKVAMMSRGRFIAFGKSEETINEENLKAIYGMDVRVLTAKDDMDNGRSHNFCIPVLGPGSLNPDGWDAGWSDAGR